MEKFKTTLEQFANKELSSKKERKQVIAQLKAEIMIEKLCEEMEKAAEELRFQNCKIEDFLNK